MEIILGHYKNASLIKLTFENPNSFDVIDESNFYSTDEIGFKYYSFLSVSKNNLYKKFIVENITYRARTFANEWQYGYSIDYVDNGVTIGKITFYN